jgi:hypothetical protein
MTIAVVQNNLVIQITNCNTDEEVRALSVGENIVIDISGFNPMPQVGWPLVGNALVAPANQIISIKITKLAFRERFTIAEMATVEAIEAAGGSTGFTLRAIDKMEQDAKYIDLNRADTHAQVGALVAMGVISQARANTILTTPPNETELYYEGTS